VAPTNTRKKNTTHHVWWRASEPALQTAEYGEHVKSTNHREIQEMIAIKAGTIKL